MKETFVIYDQKSQVFRKGGLNGAHFEFSRNNTEIFNELIANIQNGVMRFFVDYEWTAENQMLVSKIKLMDSDKNRETVFMKRVLIEKFNELKQLANI